MTMWADNIKFVKDIIDGKYQKIDSAANEASKDKSLHPCHFMSTNIHSYPS